MSQISQFLLRQYRYCKGRLTLIRDTPHAIAGGVAIGIFFGFTPLLGFKTLLAVLFAWILRCSKLSAALAVTFHDVLLPIWPVVLRWQFQIGFFLLSRPHHLPPKVSFKHFHYETYLSWKTLNILWPTFIGSMALAVPVSAALYFLVLEIVTRANAARARHGRQSPPPSA